MRKLQESVKRTYIRPKTDVITCQIEPCMVHVSVVEGEGGNLGNIEGSGDMAKPVDWSEFEE